MATLIIGVGNADRGDDAVGLIVIRRLRRDWEHGHKGSAAPVTLIEASGEGTALIEAWRSADTVILVDAVHSGAAPGTIHRLDAHAWPIPTNLRYASTHALGVAEAIELARALGQLPQRLIVYGIEGYCFGTGTGLSAEVERAAEQVLELLKETKTISHLSSEYGVHPNVLRECGKPPSAVS
jgi:hydrogenase maturation protease